MIASKIEQNSKHILACVGFLNFDSIQPSLLEQALRDHPEYENVLPTITSDRIAFSKMREELDNYKTSNGRLLTNKGEKEDLSKWTCFTEEIQDAFSILHTIANSEGHDAEPDGVIALSKKGNVLVSSSAFLLCQKIGFDPEKIFEKHKGKIDSLSMRKAFTKFESTLSVKAIKLNNGSILIHPSLTDYVKGYIEILRKLGVDERFVNYWNISIEDDQSSIQQAYRNHTIEHLKGLEERLKENENARESTIRTEQEELKALLDIVQEFQIPDALIKEFARLDSLLTENLNRILDKHTNKTQTKTKTKKDFIQMTTRFEINTPCQIKLKRSSRPKTLFAHRFAYEHETKVIEYLDNMANKFFLDVSKYSEILIELIKDEDTKTIHQIIVATSMINTEEISIESIPDTNDAEQDDSTKAATDVIATQETTDHGLYQVETQESDIKPTTTIESEPEEDQNVEIRLTDVQNWVIKNAQIGKPAKYTDAISLFGQKTVDTAISQNLIFNFRGFLEEN
jgi:hypothetical protein